MGLFSFNRKKKYDVNYDDYTYTLFFLRRIKRWYEESAKLYIVKTDLGNLGSFSHCTGDSTVEDETCSKIRDFFVAEFDKVGSEFTSKSSVFEYKIGVSGYCVRLDIINFRRTVFSIETRCERSPSQDTVTFTFSNETPLDKGLTNLIVDIMLKCVYNGSALTSKDAEVTELAFNQLTTATPSRVFSALKKVADSSKFLKDWDNAKDNSKYPDTVWYVDRLVRNFKVGYDLGYKPTLIDASIEDYHKIVINNGERCDSSVEPEKCTTNLSAF